MKVTREVVTDLLPIYFSGEASGDTKTLVEDYFRQDPDFERMARGAAKPLDALRAVTTVAPEAEKEKRDLQCVRMELWRRKAMFGVALFFTLAPLAFVYSKGHITWMMVRNAPWDAGFYWVTAALLWALYFARLRRRTASLVMAIFFALIPGLSLHGFGVHVKDNLDLLQEAIFFWGFAALLLYQAVALPRRRTCMLILAIFLTLFPVPFLLYPMFTGGPHIGGSAAEPAIVWGIAVVMWSQYFRLRRKADSDC